MKQHSVVLGAFLLLQAVTARLMEVVPWPGPRGPLKDRSVYDVGSLQKGVQEVMLSYHNKLGKILY